MLSIIVLVICVIVGLLVLFSKKEPNKLDYFFVWICLILQLVLDVIEKFI